MPGPNDRQISKFLSLVLRHSPEKIGLTLDHGGWATLSELIAKSQLKITAVDINRVVAASDKQRFSISSNGQRIRANQGHSIDVDLGLEPLEPPAMLYHGTASRFVAQIMKEGLTKQQRQFVHLSPDPETARKVGARHGKPVILEVAATRMTGGGLVFYRSVNGVWLCDTVPAEYLSIKPLA